MDGIGTAPPEPDPMCLLSVVYLYTSYVLVYLQINNYLSRENASGSK